MQRHIPGCLVLLGLCALAGMGDTVIAADPARHDAYLENGRFTVSISGLNLSAEAVSVEVDPIVFQDGLPQFGQARFQFRLRDPKAADSLAAYVKEAFQANSLPNTPVQGRTIVLALYDRQGVERRRYVLNNSVAIGFAPTGSLRLFNSGCGGCARSDDLAELVVQIGSIAIKDTPDASRHQRADEPVGNNGFIVEFKPVNPAPNTSVADARWESVDGGALLIEVAESTIGADGYRTFAPGDSKVSPLVLSGYVTPNRPTLAELMADALAGKAQRGVQALVTPVPPRPTNRRPRRYQDCLISKITVPGLSAGSARPAKEEITLAAEQVEEE